LIGNVMDPAPHPRFDVFLSYNSQDKALVRAIDERLRDEGGLRPWLDEFAIPGGVDWEATISAALASCESCIIFLGASGWGQYHQREARLAVAKRNPTYRVVAVLLPGADAALLKHVFGDDAGRWQAVNFREGIDADAAFHALLTGIHPRPESIPPLEGLADLSPYFIRRTARRWKLDGRGLHSDSLFSGKELADAQTVAERNRDDMNELAWEFLSASEQAARATRDRQRRNMLSVIFGLSAGMVIVTVLAFLFLRQRDTAIAERLAAESSTLRLESDLQLERSVLLGIESLRRRASIKAEQDVRIGLGLLLNPVARVPQSGPSNWLRFSRGDRYLVAGSYPGDEVGRVWKFPEMKEIALPEGQDDWRMVLAGDAAAILVSSVHDGLQVRQLETGQAVAKLKWQGVVAKAELTPNGQHMLIVGEQGPALLYDLRSGQSVGNACRGLKLVSASLSPVGDFVSCIEETGEVTIASVPALSSVSKLKTGGSVKELAWSGDGTRIAAADAGDRVTLHYRNGELIKSWDVAIPNGILVDHSGNVVAVQSGATVRAWRVESPAEWILQPKQVGRTALNPDGSRIATGAFRVVPQLWDLRSRAEVARLTTSPLGQSPELVFSNSGDYLAVANLRDEIAPPSPLRMEIYETRVGTDIWRSPKLPPFANGLVISASDPTLIASGTSGGILIWNDVGPPRTIAVPGARGERVRVLALSRNSKRFLCRYGKTTAILNIEAPAAETVLTGKVSVSTAGDFRADGRYVATVAESNVEIWDAHTGERAFAPSARKSEFALFDTQGDMVFVQCASGKGVCRWNPATGVETVLSAIGEDPVSLSHHAQKIAMKVPDGVRVCGLRTGECDDLPIEPGFSAEIALSRDGTHLAVSYSHEYSRSGLDDTARIYNIASGNEVARIPHEDMVMAIVFSADGRVVWTNAHRLARAYFWQPDDLARQACARMTRNLTAAEWRAYIPEKRCRSTCPSLPDSCSLP